jgi:hypothetical protein
VSLTANLFHVANTYIAAAPLADVARSVFNVTALGGLIVFFRPLLTGIGRALVLTVRPRKTRAQRLARQPQQDTAAL